MAATSGGQCRVVWKDDETTTLLLAYRLKVDGGYFKQMSRQKWQWFADHVNTKHHAAFPAVYQKKTSTQCGEKIRGCRRIYLEHKKKFGQLYRQRTETGRETDELDEEACQAAWHQWQIYHFVFGDDVSLQSDHLHEAGLPPPVVNLDEEHSGINGEGGVDGEQVDTPPPESGSPSAGATEPEGIDQNAPGMTEPVTEPVSEDSPEGSHVHGESSTPPSFQEQPRDGGGPGGGSAAEDESPPEDIDPPSKKARRGRPPHTVTPKPNGKEGRLMGLVSEEFGLMREDKLKCHKEAMALQKEQMARSSENSHQMLQQERELEEQKHIFLREENRLLREANQNQLLLQLQHQSTMAAQRQEHELKLFAGLYEALKELGRSKGI